MKLKDLVAERETLRQRLDAQGGRGVELADEIDALTKRIERKAKNKAQTLAWEVAKHDGIPTTASKFCETCGPKVVRIVKLLSDL